VYETIKFSRRVVWGGIVVGYLLAVALTWIGIVNMGETPGGVLGSLALGVAAGVAPTLALISLDRRPTLLPAASMTAVALGVIELTLLPIWLLLALAWWWAHSRRPVRVEVSRARWWARVALALGVVLAVFALYAHMDPRCTETLADGTVREVDPADKGFAPGWRFGSVESSGESSGEGEPGGVVASSCTSDTITWGEALASILISLGVVGTAMRWPVNVRQEGPSTVLPVVT
jgi:hypothetical protein